MAILGIHDGHNATAALLLDGELTHVVQEERLTLRKNQGGFPSNAIDWVLSASGVADDGLDRVVLSQWHRATNWRREDVLSAYHAAATNPPRFRDLLGKARTGALRAAGAYEHVKRKWDKRRFASATSRFPSFAQDRITAVDHHTAHAAAAYFGSELTSGRTAVLTLDGSGDGLCATISLGEDGKLTRVGSTQAGNSIGDIYARVTHFLGFIPLEHEYKLMGMAPYAASERSRVIADIIKSYIRIEGTTFVRSVPEPTYFIGRRLGQDLAFRRFDDIAGGLQLAFEELVVAWVRACLESLDVDQVALGGGAFMNVKANGLIAKLDNVRAMFVCPSCGDESLAIGAAYLGYRELNPRAALPRPLGRLYLGPDSATDSELATLRETHGELTWTAPQSPAQEVAKLLAAGEIVARCAGRTEFGARALCNRSLLADPAAPRVVERLNHSIKRRDFWMPFAPVLLEEHQSELLENPKSMSSPHMMLALQPLAAAADQFTAAAHPGDGSARPQILSREHNPDVAAVFDHFHSITGRRVLLNTSLNIHGEPMVSSAEQAISVLKRSGLRWLWLGDWLVEKSDA